MENSKTFLRHAVIYTRTYVRESKDIYSSEEQEKVTTDFASKGNFMASEIFRDQNVSGSDFNRPGFQRMMDYLKENRWKVRFVIVINSTRLSSNPRELKRLRNFLKSNGIRIISVTQSLIEHTGKQPK